MISLKDLEAATNIKSTTNDLLDGALTLNDFGAHLTKEFPNFFKYVTSKTPRLSVFDSINILHKLAYMPGTPISHTCARDDVTLCEYLHSLYLAIDANKERIESLYVEVDY